MTPSLRAELDEAITDDNGDALLRAERERTSRTTCSRGPAPIASSRPRTTPSGRNRRDPAPVGHDRMATGGGSVLVCSVCGGGSFQDHAIIWDALAAEWELTPEERAYIDRQQGTVCASCGANLRSVALADAIRAWAGTALVLEDFVRHPSAARLAVLEINEAGMLGPVLQRLPGHVLAAYPEVDMQALPYASGSFDLVVHSDTLEHVPQPLRALEECHRVLRAGGALCFTVPTLVGRMTRSRAGLPASYHGAPGGDLDDFAVHTEFGADMWTWPLRAGFSAVAVNAVAYPAALAMTARREGSPELARQFHESESRAADLERENAALQEALATTRASTSWRVTAPARAVATAIRRLTARLRVKSGSHD